MPRKSEITPEKTLAFQQRISGTASFYLGHVPRTASWASIQPSLRDCFVGPDCPDHFSRNSRRRVRLLRMADFK
jgi:hypothetical protein